MPNGKNFPLSATFMTTSNMSSFNLELHPVLVSPADTIFATILGVVNLIWLITNTLEFFPVDVPVSFLTKPGFDLIGTGSPLFENPVSL